MNKKELIKYPVDEGLKQSCLYIAVGSDINLENQLIQKSLQENILKFTPKDSKQRFRNLEMLRKWQEKGRVIHWLIGSGNDLAGIIWYGESELPLELQLKEIPDETFAIRIYDGYTGKGLSGPFMAQSLRIYVEDKLKSGKKPPIIWLQTDTDNIPAIKAYTKLGYKQVHEDEKRVTMVLYSDKLNSIIS